MTKLAFFGLYVVISDQFSLTDILMEKDSFSANDFMTKETEIKAVM